MKAGIRKVNRTDLLATNFARLCLLLVFIAAFQLPLALALALPGLAARDTNIGYQGVEFYGSSLITREELEQLVGLKQGATSEQLLKALSKFKEKLDRKNIHAVIDVARENNKIFVTVDLIDVNSITIPVRHLINSHRVSISSEVPFQVLNDLLARREQLASQGRKVTESYDDVSGLKSFSDEACNQYAEKLHRQVPSMQQELLEVIASDPDQNRRSKAIEVLNWSSDPIILCGTFIPVVDDASEQVRASVARFIYPRIKMLPDNYPYLSLVEVFTHQLARPSHLDRVLALKCLCEIARRCPASIDSIKQFNDDNIKRFSEKSSLEIIRVPSSELLNYFAHAPQRPRTPKSIPNEF